MGILNFQQKKAVEVIDGPLILLAGAGSGKTRTLVSRIVYLIENGVSPASILAMTFTNKAAKEMKNRVTALVSHDFSGEWGQPWMGFSSVSPEVSTFHSFCLKLLRTESEAMGFTKPPVVYDSADQLSLLKKIVKELNLTGRLGDPKAYQSAINYAKTQAWGPEDVEANYKWSAFQEKFIQVYRLYQSTVQANQALDFGDIILRTYFLLKANSEVLERYQDKFRYLMVDEYQDTNRAQYLLVSLMAQKYKNLCVVGDEDQSIYGWRGADIRNILEFQRDYPNAQLIRLEENYRSTKTIISAASKLISNNKDRYDKTLFTNNEDGDPICLATLSDEREEAEYIAGEIRERVDNSGLNYEDVSIFYRSHAQSRVIEEIFRRESIPYRIVGGIAFYDRKEIKDLIAYLRLLSNSEDSLSLSRIINVPTRGIGNLTLQKLESHARKNNRSLFQTIEKIVGGTVDFLSAGVVKKLKVFHTLITSLQVMAQKGSLSDIYKSILEETGYLESLQVQNTEESLSRIENLKELSTVIQNFEEEYNPEANEGGGLLLNFLNQISLESAVLEKEETGGCVSLMTLHSSKGLEFPVVFLVGCEEGIFPTRRAMEDPDPKMIEEERRLCYVGMTRAKKYLTLTHVSLRRIYGQVQVSVPSRFLREIPTELTIVVDRSRHDGSARYAQRRGTFRGKKNNSYDDGDSQVDIQADYGSSSLYVGCAVQHRIFGMGTIAKLEGSAQDRKVTITFKGRQKKKFLVKHVELEFI